MSELAVSPAGLQATAPAYQAHSESLHDVYTKLCSRLDAEGACWGNDDAGRTFAARYVPAAVNDLDAMLQISEGLGTAAHGVYNWAQNYLHAGSADTQDVATQLTS